MKIIDVHAHYEDEKYDNDRNYIIKRQQEGGVEYIINAGAGIESSKRALEIAKEYNNVYCTIGIHPQYVEEGENIEDLKKLYNESEKEKIVAIGEIGLDYHYTKEFKNQQKELFKKQLDLARKYNKPVIIHSRDSIQDTYDILNNYR